MNVIKIEAQTLMSDTWPTYFVDHVVGGDHIKLHSTTNMSDARKVGREHADRLGLRLVDETYVPEVMGQFAARFAAVDAIEKARCGE